MLEGVVARILNKLLGKYVLDLDTENLNVGIFSGQVQLTDLRLKPEALYELDLPIEVKIGTIGKIRLQIPWNYLWNEPVIVHIEDVFILSAPIVRCEPFDRERDKRLRRAVKRKAIEELESDMEIIGGPTTFSQYLLANIINNLQINITNVHVRYEDNVSTRSNLACGLGIGTITAETTNNRWKPCKADTTAETSYYLVKIEALMFYWNTNVEAENWLIPSQYYNWKNTMASSLQNYSMNNREFDFVLKPMTTKIKMTITRSSYEIIRKVVNDMIVQDCTVVISKEQFESIWSVKQSFERMWIAWDFYALRPQQTVQKDIKGWWRYFYQATLEQRVKPYTWTRVRSLRYQHRLYMDCYKQILLCPNDTELKLDLQKYEDRLPIVNIVIARRQARLIVQEGSLVEKSLWAMLPQAERNVLCEKIGFRQTVTEERAQHIEHKHKFLLGNFNLSLTKSPGEEILVITMTQLIASFTPTPKDTYKVAFKIEGFVIEGASIRDHLVPIISSQHLHNSPAYFLKIELEKMPIRSQLAYKLNVALGMVEVFYHQYALQEIQNYFSTEIFSGDAINRFCRELPDNIVKIIDEKLLERWALNFDIKVPYLLLPETDNLQRNEHILIVDLGQIITRTELSEKFDCTEHVTQMELEERFYSRFHIENRGSQILFCDAEENWQDAKKEKDTDLHILSKTGFASMYGIAFRKLKNVPKHKFNITIPSVKLNISERKLGLLLKFLNTTIKTFPTSMFTVKNVKNPWHTDYIPGKYPSKYLYHIRKTIRLSERMLRIRKSRMDKADSLHLREKRRSEDAQRRENMNEAWARVVDLPGLEDNTSPHNTINLLLRFVVNEFTLIFSRSNDVTDRPYLMFRLGTLTTDIALMSFGPAYQLSLNGILLTDKLYTTPSGQYLDLIHSPFPNNTDVLTILYRKVDASCPDFWTHFHGVETSLVADVGTVHLLLHQEALHTLIKYGRYIYHKIKTEASAQLIRTTLNCCWSLAKMFRTKGRETPVPPGAVKYSQSVQLGNLNARICDSDFDIVNIQLSGLEMDFLFRANERFVFRAFLSILLVEHLSEMTLYTKVLKADDDKVFELKYVRHAPHLIPRNEMALNLDEPTTDGSFKFHLGQLHITVLYKLVVQLQRFLVNLEGVHLINNLALALQNAFHRATDTLTANSKINMSFNIRGPVLLFPQKSDSPNVIIFDTGDITVENFFKDYTTELIENILVKTTNITVSRGVMTLSGALEMQETIIEAITLHMDVKRFIPMSTTTKRELTWDIDGLMDTIEITLGQKDLSVILAVYVDNIGEGRLLNLITEDEQSLNSENQSDETVRSLEAFFCEPKQKDVSIKFSIDGIILLLFFDSGELLSSPIRDLNHGLGKLDIDEITTSLIIYTDRSLDGRLAIDSLLVEEMGPDANVFDKRILYSPLDDNRNNNCNITVNKPPVIDVTFHQNKTKDKSIDVIFGRLSLCLSVPFCEKLALFVLECLPRDNIDLGIINHGYVGDGITEPTDSATFNPSLTIAVRINKPEFIFLVETTSNRKRYFITKSEILSDYSRHNNRLNLALSLSGLHTLFFDLDATSPYVVLKRCDVDFSKTFNDKGDKITCNVSAICVQLCSRVVHSINDILCDIAEHFRVPELPTSRKPSTKPAEWENLWDAKKLLECAPTSEPNLQARNFLKDKIHEILLVPKTELVLVLELEEMPIFIARSTVEITLSDWSSLLNCTCEVTLQANYFNEGIQAWEPIIDPIVLDENEFFPWEVIVKICQDKSHPMVSIADRRDRKEGTKARKASPSPTSTEDESEEDMVYMEPPKSFHNRSHRGIKTSLSTFLDESDSENEDGAMEKLASAISDLFTGDWNEHEESDFEHSSDAEDESDENIEPKSRSESQANIESLQFKKCTYFLMDARETLNITITPTLLKTINDLITVYSSKTVSIHRNPKSINVVNDIGPQTAVELYENSGEKDEKGTLLVKKTYENEDSCPNSPSKYGYMQSGLSDDLNEDTDSLTDELNKLEFDLSYDYELTDTLSFPANTTSDLYDKLHRHYIKVHIPNYAPLQTTCPKKNWQKMMRLHSSTNKHIYYLLAKHTVGKPGRTLLISSPLQIRNETCFALSVLYQPSVLQQLNLEPVGDVTNPFETTMRITVLEPHEHYNVPLYIAYHCKLFLQPAYAEGLYICSEGLWWQDLATEMDNPHHITCKPKDNSKVEIFSLKVLLERNADMGSLRTHSIPNYIIHLLPPLTLQNFLPYALEVHNVDVKQHIKVEPGEKSDIYSINFAREQKFVFKVTYSGLIWHGTLNLSPDLDEKIIILTSDIKETGTTKQLLVNVRTEKENHHNVFFYASYWIVNKTELPLQIKAATGNTVIESNNQEVVLFTFKRHVKQAINLRVYESSWSNDFGLDCAGTTGLVVCKDHERKKRYSFLLNIRLSEMSPYYTTIVTFLPNFLVVNNTSKFLRYMEHNEKSDLWIDLAPNQCKIFWPETTSMEMYVKYRDSKTTSAAFFIATTHRTVLRMDKGGALTVEVTGGKTEPFQITFNDYRPGDAPILIKNACTDLYLKVQQQGQSPVNLLSPYSYLLYTWDDPLGPRQLTWNVYNNKGSGFHVDISKDGFGEERISHCRPPGNFVHSLSKLENSSSEDSEGMDTVSVNKKGKKDKMMMYWICYYEGIQKVLVFTQEQRLVTILTKSYFTTNCDYELLVSLSSVGLSIFCEQNPDKELAYVSFCDVPAIWEVNVGHKWKTLTLELASWIEDKYRLHYKKCQLKDYIHIDFEKMFMLKPFFAELKRSYSPSLYFQYRKSSRNQYFNFRVNSLQIENKQCSSHESIILYPLPTGNIKTTTPFIEMSAYRSNVHNYAIYKHISFSMEECHVIAQWDFIIQLITLTTNALKINQDLVTLYRNEMAMIHSPLTVTRSMETRCKIENLRLSQISIQLNISNKHSNYVRKLYPYLNLFIYIFPFNASPYMPAEGVKHKVTPLELSDLKATLPAVLVDVAQHLKSQLLAQYYSQVLGLQVLVNPFSVHVIPSNENIPNECDKMAMEMLTGCRCLLGHLNMSPAALEQCAVEVFPHQSIDSIQRIRRLTSYRKSSNIPNGITATSRNFNTGVTLALDMLIQKNTHNSSQYDGEVFFRGIGKALYSLITRHPDEKSDCVQIATEALRRAFLLGEPLQTHQRLTRYSNPYLGIRPYSTHESMGHHLLETIANGKYANDTYWAHAAIDKVGKSIMIVTLENIIRVNKCRLWGAWELEWVLELDEIVSVPQVTSLELILNVRQEENKYVNSAGNLTITGDKEVLIWLKQKIDQAMVVSMQTKSWSVNEN